MLIGIITSGLTFNGETIEKESLGGSETAVCCMARALAKRGHQVRVFCNCDRPGLYNGVEYQKRELFTAALAMLSFDVLISARWPQFLAVPSNAGLRVLWLHDVAPSPEQFIPGLWQVDLIMGLSDYHIDNYCGPRDKDPVKDPEAFAGKMPYLRRNFWLTSNAVDSDCVRANLRSKIPDSLIYTSRPERGFDFLLERIMPRLLEKKPKLRLYHAHYNLQNLEVPPVVEQIHRKCEALAAKFPRGSLIRLGSLPKSTLYQRISAAKLFVYPTTFDEIYCIGAAEAQACGTPVITTANYALMETVGPDSGVKIPGLPTDDAYVDKFIETTLRLLDSPDEYQRMSDAGPKWIESQGLTWDAVAGKWEAKFTEMLAQRLRENKPAVVREMVRTGNLGAAKLLVAKERLEMTEELGIAAQSVSQSPSQYVDIPTAYKKALPRFDKLFQLLTSMTAVPTSFLESGADDVSLGVVAGKAFPQMAVTVYAPVEEIAARLRQHVEQAKLPNVTVLSELPKDQRFGVVFLPDTLELQPSPQAYLEQIQKTCLADDGLFLFTSRCGRERARYDGRADQFWNFDYQDFSKLLDGIEFQIAFNDERASAQEAPRGRWCGVFKRASKYGNFDVQGKALRTRPYKRLSVCMITRNEEDWIRHALKAVAPIADELIVVDSKSTDKTQEIAKEYGCRITEIDFDNFAQARNASLDRATGDWVFWTDADEHLLSPEAMRKYLYSEIFEGYAVRQQHLMIDTPGSFDLPVRLFKRRPHYKFVGYIHEHCEDTSRGAYDNEIRPSLVIDEMDLAHYGYPNEAARRSKCSFRNMELLRRDVIDNGSKGRMLTWLLVIRDYLNIVKWSFAKNRGKIQAGSQEHKLLNAAVSTYLHFFAGGRTKYAKLVDGMYQDCLLLLGRSGLCYGGCPHPPFQVDLAFAGAVGEQPPDRRIQPAQRWFISDEELLDFLRQKGIELVTKLGITDDKKYQTNGTFPSVIPELPDAVELLGAGVYS